MSTDWTDEPIEEWYDEAHADWCETWAPRCPSGNTQRPAELVGYREREPGRLQLRTIMRASTEGVCDAIVEEDEDTVRVRVLLCWRTVIAVDDEQPLPLYAPQWEIEHNRRVEEERRLRESGLDSA